MNVAYRITPGLRKKLHEPFGELIRDPFAEHKEKMDNIIRTQKSGKIISVGDMVSRKLTEHHYDPILIIIDNKCMRKKIVPIKFPVSRVLYTRNPPGTITEEAIKTIKEALKSEIRTQIVVEGEEDLLTLAAILLAPEKSIVIYGQPKEGLVIIVVTEKKKKETKNILKEMKVSRKTK